MTIPAIIKEKAELKPRQYRTALAPPLYLRLESEALKRGTTPFNLTASIVTAWLQGELVQRPVPAMCPAPSPLSPSSSVAEDTSHV